VTGSFFVISQFTYLADGRTDGFPITCSRSTVHGTKIQVKSSQSLIRMY